MIKLVTLHLQLIQYNKVMRNINVLNDYFMRYMFAKEGHEHILLNLINAVRTDYNQEPFEEVKVLNTFNLKETVNDKQSIV